MTVFGKFTATHGVGSQCRVVDQQDIDAYSGKLPQSLLDFWQMLVGAPTQTDSSGLLIRRTTRGLSQSGSQIPSTTRLYLAGQHLVIYCCGVLTV